MATVGRAAVLEVERRLMITTWREQPQGQVSKECSGQNNTGVQAGLVGGAIVTQRGPGCACGASSRRECWMWSGLLAEDGILQPKGIAL